MGELANCIKCDKIFIKTNKTICPDCIQKEEKQFQLVYQFLKKRTNRQATIPEIAEGTGVEEKVILQFVQEKRLNPVHFPNLNYPCERCGQPIVTGTICTSCQTELKEDIQKHDDRKRLKEELEKAERKKTYFTRD
ncbi:MULTISPECIES: TIGR03826 family flagellar region protein [Gracilibacillus]|uniref:TIGR03826 family flagellar region protein n=1 Tax=Gracilibacillus TaxID=74385 RepID=UPI0008256662|nr:MULTISPECIES: TIGR03826 family flagellar region protein [Gracilibacillus]